MGMALRERMRLGRRGVIGVVIALVAVVAAGGWLATRQDASAAPQTITSTVTSGTVQDSVSATGTLEPLHEADLSFAVGGTITTVDVAAGDTVRKGEALATLDRTSLEASLTSAQAQLTAARAQYTDDSDADASSTQLASDSASVASAESQLSQAQDNLDSGVLRATMRGTIASVDLEVGDTVSGSSSSSSSGSSSGSTSGQGQASTGQGSSSSQGSTTSTASTTSTTSQVVVVSPRLFTVSAAVAADDVASVKKGMQATVTPSGGTAVYGTVTTVGLVAETSSSGSATFPVTVTLTGPQKSLYAGTTATVAIITKQQTGVLTVPTASLHTSGSTTYVTKVVGSKNVRQTVTLGSTYGVTTVVTSGLRSGDKVVVITLRTPTGSTTRTRTGTGGGFTGGGNGPPAGGFGGGGFGGGTGGAP
jgi:multidrug efflux pump subunit AcrA (membrane-fusion protein)